MTRSGGNTDPLVVLTADLAVVLKGWLDKHNGRFPNLDHNGVFVTGHQYIQNQQPHINARSIYRILVCEAKHTSLRIADEILIAIDAPEALQDGRIVVIPNPLWGHEKWLVWKSEQGCI